MTIEEYYNEMKEILNESQEKEKQALKLYCESNNPYNIGDKFTDHIGSILIERFYFSLSSHKPLIGYYGLELKKDGTPRKDGSKRYAFLPNEVKSSKK